MGAGSQPFSVAWAPPEQTAAVLTLLPELLDAPSLPPRFAVAHRLGAPAELLGAAAFVPAMRHGPSPGFRGIVRVLPGWQRRGIGRALVARLAAELPAWDAPHLLGWQAEGPGAASAFMRALGFRIDYTLHHFLIDKTVVLPMCARLVGRLQQRGRLPAGFVLLPLDQVPRTAVIDLHAREFNAGFEATDAMLSRELADPLVRALSFALWDGRSLAAYLLAGRGPDLPEVRFWASHPGLRSGWAAALVLEAFIRRGAELGWHSARYQCNANARAPLNVARRSGAQQVEVTHGWVLDLPAPVAPPTPTPQPQTATARTRLLVVAVDGLDWPGLLAQAAAGRLPHLARLVARGAQARLALPASAAASVAARWTSIACGVDPAHHGVTHDLVDSDDGLRLEPPTAADLRALPLWQLAWLDGLDACVAGWPATAGKVVPPGAGPGSMLVADGFQRAEPGVQCAWPLAPAHVLPMAARALVRAARMHPAEVTDEMLAALLPGGAAPALRSASADLMARWVSVHNLGVHWCEHGGAQLVMLRLDGLPVWQQTAAACGLLGGEAQAPWLTLLDLLLARYVALLPPDAHLWLLSDRGLDASAPPAGGLLVAASQASATPTLPAWPTLLPADAVLRMARGLLGLKTPEQPGAPTVPDKARRGAAQQDPAALEWLHGQGLPAVDLAGLRQRSLAARGHTVRAPLQEVEPATDSPNSATAVPLT